MKSKRTEIWVGLFVLLGLLLIGGVALKLGDLTKNTKDLYTIHVVFRNAAGIIKGSEVRLGGAKIGVVSSIPQITSSGDAVSLTLELNKNIHLQKGSLVQAATLNLLGDKYIEITPPAISSDTFIQPGETVFGDSGEDLEKIKTNVATISQQSIALLKRIDLAMVDLQIAAKGFAEISEKLNHNVLTEENTKNLSETLAHINQVSGKLAEVSQSFPETMANLQTSSEHLKNTSQKAESFLVKVDKEFDALAPSFKLVAPTMQSIQKSSADLNHALGALKKQEGILGALIYDKNFKYNIEDFVKHLRAQGILRYKNPNAEAEVLKMQDRARMEGPRR